MDSKFQKHQVQDISTCIIITNYRQVTTTNYNL